MSKDSDSWMRLIQIVAGVEAELTKILQSKFAIGLSEFRALQVLAKSPKFELRMQDLANHLGLNQSSVSRMVERLERNGLTIRDLCPDDRRGVYTVITDKGREHLKNAEPDYEKALREAIKAKGGEALLEMLLRKH
jgi:DNA-binding MarR family transcriptional regulator